MTGPLAQQFAQVREALPLVGFAKTRDERTEAFEEVAAALSSIERHVQDMERAAQHLAQLAVAWREHDNDPKYGPTASNSKRRAEIVGEYLDPVLAALSVPADQEGEGT